MYLKDLPLTLIRNGLSGRMAIKKLLLREIGEKAEACQITANSYKFVSFLSFGHKYFISVS